MRRPIVLTERAWFLLGWLGALALVLLMGVVGWVEWM